MIMLDGYGVGDTVRYDMAIGGNGPKTATGVIIDLREGAHGNYAVIKRDDNIHRLAVKRTDRIELVRRPES